MDEAFAEIGACRFFADGVQLLLAQQRLQRQHLGSVGARARIQCGLRGNLSGEGVTFTGMRATFSAPRNGTPGSIRCDPPDMRYLSAPAASGAACASSNCASKCSSSRSPTACTSSRTPRVFKSMTLRPRKPQGLMYW